MNALGNCPELFHASRCLASSRIREVLPEPEPPTAYRWVAKSEGDTTAASASFDLTVLPHSGAPAPGINEPSGPPSFSDGFVGMATPRVVSRLGVDGDGRCTNSGISGRVSIRNGRGRLSL